MKQTIYNIVGVILRCIVALRYSVRAKGVAGLHRHITPSKGTLFLPNHPALIDPIIVFSQIARFCPRPLVDERQVAGPCKKAIAKAFNMVTIPDVRRDGKNSSKQVQAAMGAIVASLAQGDSVLLYPSGRLYRSEAEHIGANSAVWQILQQLPDVNIVVVRSKGLWGSSFSYASGKEPFFIKNILRGVRIVLSNLLLFTPRRPVDVDFEVLSDFPRHQDKLAINSYLEAFYNETILPPVQYPNYFWQGSMPIQLPSVTATATQQNAIVVDATLAQKVNALLMQAIDAPKDTIITAQTTLAGDLGIDSLALVDIATSLEQAFGHPIMQMEKLATVQDCYLAAQGAFSNDEAANNSTITKAWHALATAANAKTAIAVPASHLSFVDNFLQLAQQAPLRPFLADRESIKTRLQTLLGVLILSRKLKKYPWKRLGIMLPASPTATIAWLACLLAGKEPVMLNWTVGKTNMEHCLHVAGVEHIITADALLSTLHKQGNPIASLPLQWVPLEQLALTITLQDKLAGCIQALLHVARIAPVVTSQVPATAAVLFTSGSEAAPKAVPLLHSNIMANAQDIAKIIGVVNEDKLIAMLPPFHSFGLLLGMALPCGFGIATIFHPNPTESFSIASLVQRYSATILAATPTFLDGILAKTVNTTMLQSLRFAFVGAEKCPDHVYKNFAEQCPASTLCEGYGITECSPVIAANLPHNNIPGTIGLPLPSVTVAIVKQPQQEAPTAQPYMNQPTVSTPTYEPAPQGERGILLVRGANVFSGYLGAAPHPFVEYNGLQWYNTGDFVAQGPTGHMTFLGRLKRFVKIGGEMVSLPQMEAVLQDALANDPATPQDGSPFIAIEPVPNSEDKGHAQLVAFTTLAITAAQINQLCKAGGLSPLYAVAKVITLEAIPLLGSGKTDYQTLKAMV